MTGADDTRPAETPRKSRSERREQAAGDAIRTFLRDMHMDRFGAAPPKQGEIRRLDDGKSVAVDYAFRQAASGEWKAYDVIIEGISYITNYRNQVAAEIQATSLDSLIVRLETQGEKALEGRA